MSDAEKCAAMWRRFVDTLAAVENGRGGVSTREVGEVMASLVDGIETWEEYSKCYLPGFFKPYLDHMRDQNRSVWAHLIQEVTVAAQVKVAVGEWSMEVEKGS